MGNRQLHQLTYNSDDIDLIQFRRLYQRFSKTMTGKREQFHISQTQELLEYEIIIHNEAFCEVIERNYYINLKKTNIKLEIDLCRFLANQNICQMKLLNYSTNLNGKKSQGKFVRLKDFVEMMTENPKIRFLDLNNENIQFTRTLKPEDKLIIEYRYLMKHQLLQNNLRLLSLTLNTECPYKIQIQCPELATVSSPTHKIKQEQHQIKCNFSKGNESSLFLLFFTMQSELQCSKIQFGADGYSSDHKYCLYLNLPLQGQMYEEMFYFNCVDPQLNEDDQSTMMSIESTSTIRSEPILLNEWPYYYNVQKLTTQRHITFFLDQSNSMEGTKIQCAKQSLQIFIRSLPSETDFNIYSFGSKWVKLFQNSKKISEPILQQCENAIQSFEGNMGSTFLLDALNDALQFSPKNQKLVWFILTDGRIAEFDKILDLLRKNNQIQVYSIGFGLEFDQESVEQLGNVSNGGFMFCQNINALNRKIVQLLQQALKPQFTMKTNLNDLLITQMYPSPQRANRELFCFINSLQLQQQSKIQLEITYQQENEPEEKQLFVCDLRSAKNNALIHLYAFIEMFEKILSEIYYEDTISWILSCKKKNEFDINDPLLLMFFNPLNIMMIDDCAILCNINIDALRKMLFDKKLEKDLLQSFLYLISDQTYEQQLACVNANQNIHEISMSIEMGSTSTQATQTNLIKLIQLQQIDGSFNEDQAIPVICKVKNPLRNIVSRMVDQYEPAIKDGRQAQQLPEFLMEQVLTTALVIAYLKLHYASQRGQWVIIYVKALHFIKQYYKNWQQLLYKARKELLRTNDFR